MSPHAGVLAALLGTLALSLVVLPRAGVPRVTSLLQRRASLVDVFPPTPAWGVTPGSVGQVGSGTQPAPGQEINVLGGDYKYPDYVRRRSRSARWALVHGIRQGQPFLEQVFPETPPWSTTPNSIGAVGSGETAAPGQDINVFGGDYVFPSYAESYGGVAAPPIFIAAKAQRGQQMLIATVSSLWGGQYSSVGKFPPGFNGQRSYGGEMNVWALPTEEQMANSDCTEPCEFDGPLASIGEHNVLDGLGNDPDSSIWNEEAGHQPKGTTGNCCGQSALGAAGGYEEPSHAWLSA